MVIHFSYANTNDACFRKAQEDSYMKKSLTISLLLAVLFTSQAFADFEIGGLASAGATMLKGSNLKGDDMQAGNLISSYIEAGAQDNSGKFGGSVRINAEASSTDASAWGWGANAWWRPILQFKLQLGTIEDFAMTDIVGWGYHANDAEDFVASPRINYVGDYFSNSTGFYAGTGNGWTGVTLAITPIYGLSINVAVPFGRGEEKRDTDGKVLQKYKAKDVYMFTHAQIAYSLYGVGRLAFSFEGGGDGKLYTAADQSALDNPDPNIPDGNYDPDLGINFDQINANASSLYASFFLTAFENRGFSMNLGFGYTLPVSTTDAKNQKITYFSPMEAGLGISVGNNRFSVKARMAALFNGCLQRDGSELLYEPLMLGFGILPSVSVGPFRFYLNAGIAYRFPEKYMDDFLSIIEIGNSAALGWHVNPYLVLTIGTGRFYAGFTLQCDGLKWEMESTMQRKQNKHDIIDGERKYPGIPVIEWGIPIGILFEF